jgi:transcription elongation factor GreA
MTKLVTKEGLQKLKEELEDRKTRVRQSIAKDIKEAKDQGDLSENAEYSEAKRQQAENEARVANLEVMIKNSQVVERNGNSNGNVEIGSDVEVKFNGNKITFHVVGASEADPANFKISNESPMGKAFLGRKKGDTVEVETPGGMVKYKILKVA